MTNEISFHNLFKCFKQPQLNECQQNDKEERRHVKRGIGTWWLVPVGREVCGWLVQRLFRGQEYNEKMFFLCTHHPSCMICSLVTLAVGSLQPRVKSLLQRHQPAPGLMCPLHPPFCEVAEPGIIHKILQPNITFKKVSILIVLPPYWNLL